MELRPLNNRVIVKRVDNETVTKGGIVIPDSAAEKPDHGNYIPLDVKVNDRVLFGKYAGTQIKVDGEDLLVLKEEEIFAVIEN